MNKKSQIIIYGTIPKVDENQNIVSNYRCTNCGSNTVFYVTVKRVPHLFFIPIIFLQESDGQGLYCSICKLIFELKGEEAYFVEQLYIGKISKDIFFKNINKKKELELKK
jgi:hypothetical protein